MILCFAFRHISKAVEFMCLEHKCPNDFDNACSWTFVKVCSCHMLVQSSVNSCAVSLKHESVALVSSQCIYSPFFKSEYGSREELEKMATFISQTELSLAAIEKPKT